MNVDNVRISQSLLKALEKYADKKECGLKIEAQYIKGEQGPSTAAQALGNWFEYECTGALPPYNPVVPEPKVLKSGKLAVSYERMTEQVNNYKKAIDFYNVTDIQAGVDMKWGNITGTADIVAKVNGVKSIIDIKTTALFDDKWNDFGWATEHLADGFRPKLILLVQALHYKWLYKNLYGEDLDFYFWVFSTQNSHDFKIIKVNIDEALYDQHAEDIRMGLNFLMHSIEKGFTAHPSITQCSKCFLKEKCSERMKVPIVSEIYYGTGLSKPLGEL